MIAHTLDPTLPKAADSSGNGRFSRITMVLSSGALISSVTAATDRPKLSRRPQRVMEATTSRPRTGSPSWNFSPSRRVSFQVLPSFSTTCPSSICGDTWALLSVPHSVSYAIIAWLRVM